MSIEFKSPSVGISGYIGMRVVNKEDGKERWTNIDPVTKRGPKNLIVDGGLNKLGSTSAATASTYCRVGTGTTAPANSQSSLVSQFGTSSNSGGTGTSTNSGGAPWWHEYEREYQFNAGTVDGAALTEVGFFDSTTGGTMFSRNLIKDSGGTPTSITLTSSEVLYVTYVIRVSVPNSDVTGTFQINSEDYNYTVRAAEADVDLAWGAQYQITLPSEVLIFSTQTLGAIDSRPGGSPLEATDSADSYVNLSNERTGSLTCSDSQGNASGGIGSFAFGRNNSFPSFQVSVDKVSDGSKIPKDNTKTLTMNSAFKISWDRV